MVPAAAGPRAALAPHAFRSPLSAATLVAGSRPDAPPPAHLLDSAGRAAGRSARSDGWENAVTLGTRTSAAASTNDVLTAPNSPPRRDAPLGVMPLQSGRMGRMS